MKVPFFALLLLVPVVALGQAPPDSGNDNATRLTPEQCRKDPAFPGCPAQPDMTATTNGDIPPGGWCDSVRPGCPTHPHIRTCDNCSAQAMQNRALLAATDEGDNYVYVVNRSTGQVRYYWVFVTFDSNGVHRSAFELATDGERPQAMKEALQAAADVNMWFKSLGSISEEDLASAGIDMPYANGFDYASQWPTSRLNLRNSIELYFNSNPTSQSFFAQATDALTSFVTDIISNLADVAMDVNAEIVFFWSDGTHITIGISTGASVTDGALFNAEPDRVSLQTAGDEYIPPDLAGFGISGSGGTTDQYAVGDDPSGQTAFRSYLRRLAGRHCTVTTNCFEDSQGHYQCIGTVEC